MKKRIQIICTLVILLVSVTLSFAQEKAKQEYLMQKKVKQEYFEQKSSKQGYTKVERSNELFFKVESKTSEVQVSVTDEFNFLSLKIECHLTVGELTVEIFNPKGELKGDFTVINNSVVTKGKNTQSKETVAGQIEKHFRTPHTGIWLIRINPKNATGTAVIVNTMVYNPRESLLEYYEVIPDTESKIK